MGTIGKVCNSKECSVSVKPKMALLKGKEPRSKGTDTSPGERERLEKTSCLEKQPESVQLQQSAEGKGCSRIQRSRMHLGS